MMSADLLQLGFVAATFSAFLIGLSFGTGPCNLSCLPYLGPVLLGPGAQRPFVEVVLPFMSGRLLGYLCMGTSAALLGGIIKSYLAHPLVPIFAAVVSLWLALKMWRQAGEKNVQVPVFINLLGLKVTILSLLMHSRLMHVTHGS
ncbi:sulfite exporter TauE/SafE family protein [Neptuniibacter marinus]|uniref:urease accessory protein UreH domain-containing protein n=1 Tax=Neptuniibacter marinus TaxID=1806670 RepID=UPI003B5ABD1B